MLSTDSPILYVKTGCPWCREAISFLTNHGVEFQEKNVTEDSQAFDEMKRKSGQTRTPTFDWHGKILADFGVDELVPFLEQQSVRLADR